MIFKMRLECANGDHHFDYDNDCRIKKMSFGEVWKRNYFINDNEFGREDVIRRNEQSTDENK